MVATITSENNESRKMTESPYIQTQTSDGK